MSTKPSTPSAFDNPLLDPDEAAAYLCQAKATLYAKVSRRQIAFVKVGRSLRFRKADLDKLIRQGYHPALRPLPALEDPGDAEGGGR